jgi:hypothetical protein
VYWQRLVFSIIDLFLEGGGIHHLNGNDSLYRAVILWKTAVVLCHLALNPTQGSNGGYLYADTREKLRVWKRNSRGMAYYYFFRRWSEATKDIEEAVLLFDEIILDGFPFT